MSVARIISTPRLTLRAPEAGDLGAYTAYCASDRSQYVGGPYNAVQAFDKLAAMIGHWPLRGFGRYVITHDTGPVGHVGPLQMDDSHAPEMTWTLWDGAHEGQGFASEAADAVRQHLLDEQHWPELIIRIMPNNTASRRLAEKLGAKLSDDPAPHWMPNAVTYWLRRGEAA